MSAAMEARALSVLDCLSNGVLLLDSGQAVRLANRSAEHLMGISAQACEGHPASNFLSAEILAAAEEAVRLGRPRHGVTGRARTPTGQMRAVRVNVTPLEDSAGVAGAAVVSFAPLATLDHRERRRQMDERLRALGEFSAAVAHVVRNPLAGISSGVEFLGRQVSRDPVQVENVAAVLREVRRLDGLLEDLLRITHPPALELRPVRVEALLGDVVRGLEARFPGVVVAASCEARVGQPRLDGEQVRRALTELSLNAAEASLSGARVEISASLAEPDETLAELGEPLLRIDVTDRGPGLPAPVRRAPFEPFRSSRAGARGLGLYTAHDVASRHGGELRLRDLEGGGTRATLYLPWETRDDD